MTLRWRRASRGHVTDVDWAQWTDERRHVDPYLVWADLTGFKALWRDSHGTERDDTIPLLVELDSEAALALSGLRPSARDGPRDCSVPLAEFIIPAVYKEKGGAALLSRYFTARCSPGAICNVLKEAGIRRFQLGLPRIPRLDTQSFPFAQPATAGPGVFRRTVVGFIDDGCAFAHPRFLDLNGAPRVRWLWDQNTTRREGGVWRAPPDLLYGAELGPQALDGAVRGARSDGPASGGAFAAYQKVDYVPVRLDPDSQSTSLRASRIPAPVEAMLGATHGSSAMDLGVGGPDSPLRVQERPGRSEPDKPLPVDTASSCPLIFVQLPTQAVLDTSGGSLGVHVLDGLRYIIERSYRVPYRVADPSTVFKDDEQFDNRVIVNVSYGAVAGPHDGTSIIENAIDNLVYEASGVSCNLWVVIPTGNAHRSRTHAQLDLTPGHSGMLHWQVGPDNPHEAFLEIWLPDADTGGRALPEQHLRNFQIGLIPPVGDPLPLAQLGDIYTLDDESCPGEIARAGIVFARKVAQGMNGTMVLLAVGPTRHALAGESSNRSPAPHGLWRVDVCYKVAPESTTPQVRVHAWAERNDLLYGNLRPQQSFVAGDDPVPEPTEFTSEALAFAQRDTPAWLTTEGMPRPFQPDAMLASLSGGKPARTSFERVPPPPPAPSPGTPVSSLRKDPGAVVVVGGYRLSDGEIASYSGGGPDRRSSAETERARIRSGLQARGKARVSPTLDPLATLRDIPDVDAPSDAGPALRGLRVTGTRPGLNARMSGTSAAAPTVTRFLADTVFQSDNPHAPEPVVPPTDVQRERDDANVESGPPHAARPTPTPTLDDLFRRGRQRLK